MNEAFWVRANAVLRELQAAGMSDAKALAWFGVEQPNLGVPADLLRYESEGPAVMAAARKAGAS